MNRFDGNQTPGSIEKVEIDGDEWNNSDENHADTDGSMKKVMTSLMMLKFL